ncbi:TrmH family RNA methyltransferase [Pararhizobium haloflavum]|uniref:TrmH family RNA methyltransferase n=1 Tax=Pararhizobium haloflavum TaxID=2037914 RepID=UPI001FDED661|nr:RNA methyltransferase [Pararhizobium haloflavum]
MSDRRVEVVTDPADPRIAPYRSIRERDMRRQEGRFIVEGTVVLRMLADVHGGPGGFRAESLFILENRLAGVRELVDRFPPEVPVFVASRAVMDEVAGFPMHRGVLALASDREAISRQDVLQGLPDPALVLVACGISNHDNVGALFRNAAAFGADAIVLDEQSCDPLYRKAIRVSVGSVLKVPFMRGGSESVMIEALEASGFELWGLSPRGEVPVGAIEPGQRVALVVGTEGEGLSQSAMARMRTARIEQLSGLDSLNVATAAAIALHTFALRMGKFS